MSIKCYACCLYRLRDVSSRSADGFNSSVTYVKIKYLLHSALVGLFYFHTSNKIQQHLLGSRPRPFFSGSLNLVVLQSTRDRFNQIKLFGYESTLNLLIFDSCTWSSVMFFLTLWWYFWGWNFPTKEEQATLNSKLGAFIQMITSYKCVFTHEQVAFIKLKWAICQIWLGTLLQARLTEESIGLG